MCGATNTGSAFAATPKKCPKCKQAYTYQVKICSYDTKSKINRTTEWKKVGNPMQNCSKRTVLMGFAKGKSSTVKYTISGGASWNGLKLGGSYEKSSTKTTTYQVNDWVKAKWWCNLYLAHTVDNFNVTHTVEKRCQKCGYLYNKTVTKGKAKIPVKTNDIRVDFRKSSKKSDVNK